MERTNVANRWLCSCRVSSYNTVSAVRYEQKYLNRERERSELHWKRRSVERQTCFDILQHWIDVVRLNWKWRWCHSIHGNAWVRRVITGIDLLRWDMKWWWRTRRCRWEVLVATGQWRWVLKIEVAQGVEIQLWKTFQCRSSSKEANYHSDIVGSRRSIAAAKSSVILLHELSDDRQWTMAKRRRWAMVSSRSDSLLSVEAEIARSITERWVSDWETSHRSIDPGLDALQRTATPFSWWLVWHADDRLPSSIDA